MPWDNIFIIVKFLFMATLSVLIAWTINNEIAGLRRNGRLPIQGDYDLS